MELEPDSSKDLVRRQYIKLAKKHHPDTAKNTEDMDVFQKIDQAYKALMEKFAEDKRKDENCAGEYGLYYEEGKNDGTTNHAFEHPDIEHTAPQHRQYLSNEGFGYGNVFQRQKQYQKFRAIRAAESVSDHNVQKLTAKYETQLAVQEEKDKKKAKKHMTRNAMERLVEDLISESMAKGEFDNLGGAGKPLPERVIYNPYEDFTTHKMNQILVDGGFAPEWIMLKKDIDKMKEDLKEEMGKHCLKFLRMASKNSSSGSNYDLLKEKWFEYCNQHLQGDVVRLNNTINKYNLMVPMIQSQKFHMDLLKQAETVWNATLVNFKSLEEISLKETNSNSSRSPEDPNDSSLLTRLTQRSWLMKLLQMK